MQTGHGILAFILLLAASVYNVNNPLTSLPDEIRDALKHGLKITYSINAVIAVQAYFTAKKKHLPSLFWLIKTFLFGGIALYEVQEAKDPTISNKKNKNKKNKK